MQAGYGSTAVAVASSAACQLERIPKVARYLQALRELSLLGDALSIAEIRQTLAETVRTPINEVDETSPLVQSITYDSSTSKDGTVTKHKQVKMLDKIKAIELDCKISGAFEEILQDQRSNPFLMLINLGKMIREEVEFG